MSGRAASPFHCPYCGDDALFPHEAEGWECRSCLRAFKVTFLGQIARTPQRSPATGDRS